MFERNSLSKNLFQILEYTPLGIIPGVCRIARLAGEGSENPLASKCEKIAEKYLFQEPVTSTNAEITRAVISMIPIVNTVVLGAYDIGCSIFSKKEPDENSAGSDESADSRLLQEEEKILQPDDEIQTLDVIDESVEESKMGLDFIHAKISIEVKQGSFVIKDHLDSWEKEHLKMADNHDIVEWQSDFFVPMEIYETPEKFPFSTHLVLPSHMLRGKLDGDLLIFHWVDQNKIIKIHLQIEQKGEGAFEEVFQKLRRFHRSGNKIIRPKFR